MLCVMIDKVLTNALASNSNTIMHNMIFGRQNFIGIEMNKEFRSGDFDMVVRQQLRVSIADNLLIGIVGGIPISRKNQRLSTFARLIWEPGIKHGKLF